MPPVTNHILTINGGSSSIKFAIYDIAEPVTQVLQGEVVNIGMAHTQLTINNTITHQNTIEHIQTADHTDAAYMMIDRLEQLHDFTTIKAIGHRIVHGMNHTEPELVTPILLDELKKISVYDPDHLPDEIKLIDIFKARHPALAQVACFDTSFHTTMLPIAKILSIPRRYKAMGIQRYGFHGLSYTYLMEELNRVAGAKAANGKIILAHLGSGASVAAVYEGKSIDTSMGFTPASGLVMGTRTGDLDPGVAWYLMQTEKLNAQQFSRLINYESGLLGVSETSSDMRELMQQQQYDNRAAEAIELFCYQTKKWIGAYAATLGGIDTVVFSGGIGENAAEVRTRICHGLAFLGIVLDEDKNKNNEAIISAYKSTVCVRVIKTNEEWVIAKSVCRLMHYTIKK